MNKKNEKNLKTIPVDEAAGTVLMHDITRIIPGKEKGPAFKKGHIVKPENIETLKDMGKENLYAFEVSPDKYHENDAAEKFKSLAGKNISIEGPSEGKIVFKAKDDGLIKIDKETVNRINKIGDIALTTLHTDVPVKKGGDVAGMRAIPLVVDRKKVDRALETASGKNTVEIKPYKNKKIGLLVTGEEVASGRIEDGFKPVIEKKVKEYGSRIVRYKLTGDRPENIKNQILKSVERGCNFIILTGGMSVDPDDKTKKAIIDAGVRIVRYGVPVLPGNMFMVGYLDKIPVFGVPACALFHNITVLDIYLPYAFSDTKITGDRLTKRGYGGYCRHCEVCVYPRCALGKF